MSSAPARAQSFTERVSVNSSGMEVRAGSHFSSISADGRCVVFGTSAAVAGSGSSGGRFELFVHDRTTGRTECVSVDSAGVAGNRDCDPSSSSISADGRFVAFDSHATNLVPGDTNGCDDVFVHDRLTGTTERVSVRSNGAEGDAASGDPSISADGRIVAFESIATNLVDHDSNGTFDVFAHERCTVAASWSNYGQGFPGTNGVPSLTSLSDPVFGTGVAVDLGNSTRGFTVAALFVGFERAMLPSSFGGDLLVVPALTTLVVVLPQGTRIPGAIPDDERLGGLTVDLQAIELDPGAAHGVSFTAGLELVLGI
jgi:Tol biopolymer transport system component